MKPPALNDGKFTARVTPTARRCPGGQARPVNGNVTLALKWR